MEHSLSSLVYKGSISEAISEARRQKKLFVVYISGDNAESRQLEELTWKNEKVSESISKYCILLHISEGSVDATNFSAIYPQKSAPCITAIGFNGVQLWQNEGFVDADVLSSSLEKVWFSLHIQETTATFLTAALASKKSEPQSTSGADAASFEQGSSSNTVPSPSTDEHIEDSESRAATSSLVENTGFDHGDKVQSKQNNEEESSGSVSAEVKPPISSTESAKEIPSPVEVNVDNIGDGQTSSGATDQFPASEVSLNVVGRHLEVSTEPSGVISNKATESLEVKSSEVVEDKFDSGVATEISQLTTNKSTERVKDKEADDVEEDKRATKSTDAYLNIRLHDGATLQEKFVLTSTLRLVKDYVDSNITSTVGSYDLAIPYPRKVFNDQDLNKTLSDLGLSGRQTLIVVPHRRPAGNHKGESSSRPRTIGATNSVSPNNEGYFAYLRRMLSYVNPFSYLGGGGATPSNSANETRSGMWQYDPNPALQNNLRRGSTVNSPDRTSPPATTGGNPSKNKRPAPYRFGSGSNIHTLKRDDDDPRFNDKNSFWNGNSTEYGGGGGDNDRK